MELKPLAVQYADYALWQRSWLKGEVLEQQRGYWREQLEGAPGVLDLPTDHARPLMQSFRGAYQPIALSPELSRSLERLARAEGVTPFMVLLSAYQVLLSRWSGQAEIVVGSPIANRTHAETEGLIGFFVNTLALYAEIRGEESFLELLQRQLLALAHPTHRPDPLAAANAGVMPGPGQANLSFINAGESDATLTINERTFRIAAGSGVLPDAAPTIGLPPGKCRYSLQLANGPVQNNEVELTADEARGLTIDASGLVTLEQVY